MPAPPDPVRYAVVVPVKVLAVAKSRLALPPAQRAALALAMALDTVRAALACLLVEQVLVVTDDPLARATLQAAGARVVPDSPDAGLNAALAHGADLLRTGHPWLGVATLGSDLPALTPDTLADALGQVRGRVVVPDLDGTGTTLLAAAPGHPLDPAYGPGSRDAHVAGGAVVLGEVSVRLRRDVDTLADLAAAVALGVGPATAAVLASR